MEQSRCNQESSSSAYNIVEKPTQIVQKQKSCTIVGSTTNGHVISLVYQTAKIKWNHPRK